MEYDLTVLEQKLRESPDDIQEVVSSEETLATVESVAREHALEEGGTLALVDIATHTLLGLLHPGEVVTRIASDAKVDLAIAKNIAQKLNQKIFLSVERSLSDRYKLSQPFLATLLQNTPAPISSAPTAFIQPPAPTTPVPQTPAPIQPTSMFEEKLKRVFTVPREESRIAGTPIVPAAPKAPVPSATPRPAGSDPYREPLH